KDNWNGRGCPFDGQRRRGRGDDDHIDLHRHHFGSESVEALGMTLGTPTLDDQIPALDISDFRKAGEKALIKLLVAVRQKSHAPGSAGVLRTGLPAHPERKRRTGQGDDVAPPHTLLWRSDGKSGGRYHGDGVESLGQPSSSLGKRGADRHPS